MNKEEIIQKLSEGFSTVETIITNTDIDSFFHKKGHKWSAAENVKHLILSVVPLIKAFSLPDFALLFFGQLNRPAKSYDEVIEKYQRKLSEGVVATAPFIPTAITSDLDKSALMVEFTNCNNEFLKQVENFQEEDLDKYLIPHPVLGKLTIREMLYFTIYHTLHHHKAILETLK